MTEELHSLVDEHITLLAEARRERDHYKQLSLDYHMALRGQQEAKADLLAALEVIAHKPLTDDPEASLETCLAEVVRIAEAAIAKNTSAS